MSKKLFGISMLGLVALAGPVFGSTVIYCNESACGSNNEAAFETATSSLTFGSGFEDFLTNGSYTSGLTNADGITGLDFYAYNDNNTQVGVTVTSNVMSQNAGGTPSSIEAALPSGLVYAYAVTFTTVTGGASPCIEPTITAASSFNGSNCDIQMSISSPSDVEFVGIVSSTPLTDVFIGSFNGSANALSLESFELGEQPAPTPEVGTLLLIGTGLILMRVLHRRQKKNAGSTEEKLQWRDQSGLALSM